MRKISILFVLVLSVIKIYAQDSIIELKKEPINIPNRNFFIDNVIDGRKTQGNIGVIRMGVWGKRVRYYLKSSLSAEIFDYLNNSFPKDSSKIPITLKVIYLNISQSKTYYAKIGKAEIKVEFYRNMNNKLLKLFETKAVSEEQDYGVNNDNEYRIRKALTACLKSFNSSNWQSIILNYPRE
jgi:hypothetical protein